ncbi:MAG TPA: hypothetical protein VG984_03620 [Candidatus Paceibacterota bacterium]|nr:hypothetical protein [Candidatus Paceibacterota bacterium]
MKSQFAHCHLDKKTGLVWCMHLNGSWAPPFTAYDVSGDEDDESETAITSKK